MAGPERSDRERGTAMPSPADLTSARGFVGGRAPRCAQALGGCPRAERFFRMTTQSIRARLRALRILAEQLDTILAELGDGDAVPPGLAARTFLGVDRCAGWLERAYDALAALGPVRG